MTPQEREGSCRSEDRELRKARSGVQRKALAQKSPEMLRNAGSTRCEKAKFMARLVREIKKRISGQTSIPFSYLCLCPFFTARESCENTDNANDSCPSECK